MNSFIDTHAHIYADELKPDIAEVLERSRDVGVSHIYMPNIDSTSIDGMLELAHRHPGYCIPMMGLHPCYVKKDFERELYVVEDWLAKQKFVAIGEIGTDLYWDTTFWPQQQEAFRVQISWAKQYKLPVIIHCRESIEETIAMVEELKEDGLTGIFHCFSGTPEQAKRIMGLGFLIGIGGVSTFKNGGLDKVIPEIGLEAVVLETDSPYLAPVPHRGKRNEPSYLTLVAARVAELSGKTLEEVGQITNANAQNLFNPSPLWK
jgi:TatD DNase family protein